jgi:putative glutamine amidotransferase
MNKPILLLYRDDEDLPPYREAAAAGGLVARCAEPRSQPNMEDFSGLLLTGGNDVDPALYGEARHPATEDSDPERDQVEIRLLKQALTLDLPVLAICRGLQIMNVMHGGTLTQHLEPPERHRVRPDPKSTPAHEIRIEPQSLLWRIAETDHWQVNSRHHQAVKTLGAGLRVSAIDPADGTIEAIERPDKRFVLAVQWHPENEVLAYPDRLKLFQRFADALELRQQ